MWPSSWGPIIWPILHAIGKAFAVHYPEAIPPELSEALFEFMVRLCKYLLCPACRGHCLAYTGQTPPHFTKGTEVWTYFVDFHNAVNKRTNKLELSYDEAETLLAQQLNEFGWKPDQIEDAFLQDWWTGLLLTTFSISLTPDTPKEEEKKEFQTFMRHAAMVMPFSFKKLASGNLVRSLLVTFVDSPAFDLATRDTAFGAITNMHNSVCSEFGLVPKLVKEMKELFGAKFEQKNVTQLIRAVQIHEEDQKKMLALQQELNELRSSGVVANSEGVVADGAGVNSAYQTATIALSCLLGVVLLLLVVMWTAYRFKWAGDWRLVRMEGKKSRLREVERTPTGADADS